MNRNERTFEGRCLNLFQPLVSVGGKISSGDLGESPTANGMEKKRIKDNALGLSRAFARTDSIAIAGNQFAQRDPPQRIGIGRQVATISLDLHVSGPSLGVFEVMERGSDGTQSNAPDLDLVL